MFSNDFDRIKKLGRYLTKDKKTIYLILIVLLPVSFAGAIQPLLVGQAITILKNESTDVWLSNCLLYTSPSPRDRQKSRMPSSA